jgi:CrcB protein
VLILEIALAGAIGAVARFLLDGRIQEGTSSDHPVGTLVINVSGSLLLGFLTGLTLYHAFPGTPKTVLGTGFCGGYTTFSTYAYETVQLTERRNYAGAARYFTASFVLPLLAAAAGWALATL